MLHAAVTSLEHTCLSKYYALKHHFVYSMVVASFTLSIAAAINQIDVDSRKTRKQYSSGPFSSTADVDEAG